MRLVALAVLAACSLWAAQDPPGFAAASAKAKAARETDNIDLALTEYTRALKLKPGWNEGWWYLGLLNYESDHYIDGRDAFRHLLSLDPKMAAGWALLGLCEFEDRKYDEALAHVSHGLELGLAANPEIHDVALYHQALMLTRGGEFGPAMAAYADFSSHGKENPKYVEGMGIAALRKPVLPSELPPQERELVMAVGRAMCDAAARRTKESLTEIDSVLQQHPSAPQLHLLKGLLSLTSDPDVSIAEFKKELEITPNNAQALYSLAQEYVKRGDFKSAAPYAERAVESEPNASINHLILGRALVDGDIDVKRGTEELLKAENLAPRNYEVHFALASAYSKSGDSAAATRERAEFQRLRKLGSADAQ